MDERNDQAIANSKLLWALEGIWSSIQKRHPDVPDVVFTFGQGSHRGPSKGKPILMGHFAPLRWQVLEGTSRIHEIFVAAEFIADADETLGTVIHEAAHAVASHRKVKDCSRQGRWHNKLFKAIAEELGLDVTKDARLGWQNTLLRPETRELYLPQLECLAGVVRAYRLPEPDHGRPPRPTPPEAPGVPECDDQADDQSDDQAELGDTPEPAEETSGQRLLLICACGRRLRMSASVWAAAPVICGACKEEFSRAVNRRVDGGLS